MCSSRSSPATTTRLQVSAERRNGSFNFKAYYTLSKSVEDVDFQGGGLPAVQNSNRLDMERGRASVEPHP